MNDKENLNIKQANTSEKKNKNKKGLIDNEISCQWIFFW